MARAGFEIKISKGGSELVMACQGEWVGVCVEALGE